MKAKRVIIASLLLLLLLSGVYVWKRGGDFSALSSAYASGGGSGGGIRQVAASLWMTMVNTELGLPSGAESAADGSRAGAAPAAGRLYGDDSSTALAPGGAMDSDVDDAGLNGNGQPAPVPVPGATYDRASSTSIGARIYGWIFGDDTANQNTAAGPAAAGPGAQPGRAYGDASSTRMNPESAGADGGVRDGSDSSATAAGDPVYADGTDGLAPGTAYNRASSTSIGGRIFGWIFGDDSTTSSANGRSGANGRSAANGGDPAAAGQAYDRLGDATSIPGQSTPGSPAMGGPEGADSADGAFDETELAQAEGGRTPGELAMGQSPGQNGRPIPRAVDFDARLREREATIARHQPLMAGVGFPVSVQEARSLEFREFLGRTHRAHGEWFRRRAELVADYNRARARDRAALRQNFEVAKARDRRDGGQKHLLEFMAASRRFNAARAAQNGRFQAMLDETGARIGRRFQYLFHINLARHIARQERTRPERDIWIRHKSETLAAAGAVYSDGRAPAASRGVNQGVRRYMNHWIAFFYNKKIGDPPAEAPREEPQPDRPGPVRKVEQVEKFRPQENCGPTDLNTYSLDRMRRYIKSLESNCPAANGLPDLLLKTCAQYHVQIDLKVACKRDIYYFLKFDSENTYDRNQAIDHFNDGCRPYRSIGDLARKYTGDLDRGIDSLQKDKMERMLSTMRSCSPELVPPPVRKPVAPAPGPRPRPALRPGSDTPAPDSAPVGPSEDPAAVPENMPGKEPEAAPEPADEADTQRDGSPGTTPAPPGEPEKLPPAENLGFPE